MGLLFLQKITQNPCKTEKNTIFASYNHTKKKNITTLNYQLIIHQNHSK